MSMILHNARLMAWSDPNCILDDHAVNLEDGMSAQVGPSREVLAGKPSAEELDACQEPIPEGAGFYVHVAVHEVDQYDSLEKWTQWMIDRLEKRGILGEGTIAVHVGIRERIFSHETG